MYFKRAIAQLSSTEQFSSYSFSMANFETVPGFNLRGPPVPRDLSSLVHRCGGPDCSFCAWRRQNLLDLGWERLLDDSASNSGDSGDSRLCGVELTCSQLEDPYTELSTQQTADFLAHVDDDCTFPSMDAELEQVLSQYDSFNPSVPAATFLSTSTTVSTVVSTADLARAPLTTPFSPPSVASTASRRLCSSPKGNQAVNVAKACSIPARTQVQTDWTVRMWTEWAQAINLKLLQEEQPFSIKFDELTLDEMDFWLSRFVLEVRKANGDAYPPNSLYQLVCGLQRHLRNHGVKLFENHALHGFRCTLDGEMKRLNATGKYVNKKQAQPITPEQEDRLWELKLLGDHNPQVLLNTMVFQVGFYFALKSGNEHRRLRHSPPQITLYEPPGERSYLVYREDVSKTNQGGLSSRKKKPKEVYQYANMENPSRCFVQLYKLYRSKCPTDRPASAFYLTPLARPKETVWYSKVPIGHNVLGKVVSDMMNQAGFEGQYPWPPAFLMHKWMSSSS